MKKLFCLVLSAALLLSAVPALAVEYTLPEKLQRQIDFGNGVRGALKVNLEGEAEWVQLLQPLNGVEFLLRSITKDGRFQHKLYTQQGEEMLGLTQLYGDEGNIYLSSALLPDKVLTLATGGDVVDQLLGTKGGNATWYSAAMNLLDVPETTWEGKWMPELEKYFGVNGHIEYWLNDFASEPSIVKNAAGESVMLIRYDIPAHAVKEEIMALVQSIMADEALMTLLRTQMTEEQLALYLNPNLAYYYAQVIEGIKLEGTIVMEREMTTMGEIIRTQTTLPLPENAHGWTALVLDEGDNVSTFTLRGADEIILKVEKTITTDQSDTFMGHVYYTPAEADEKLLAAAYTLVRIPSTSTDDDSRSHDITTWNLSVRADVPEGADTALYKAFEPMQLDARIHYHSKNANYSPTTMAVALGASFEGNHVTVQYEIQTRSPWEFDQLPTEGALDVSAMDEEEVTQMLTDLGMNGLVLLMSLQPQQLPAPEEAPATPTDLAGDQQS